MTVIEHQLIMTVKLKSDWNDAYNDASSSQYIKLKTLLESLVRVSAELQTNSVQFDIRYLFLKLTVFKLVMLEV